jgi:5-(carboxyamino)imidazole ribonucleotide mutase
MPNGVPVATMGLGSQGPRNAALLAAGILAIEDESLLKKLKQRRDMLKAG